MLLSGTAAADPSANATKQIGMPELPPAGRPLLRPLLYGISDGDLDMAKTAARLRYGGHWILVSERSRLVRQRLLESLNRQQVPQLLQVIPIVESTYNPYALSHSGALGLWQLMPKTARSLGIAANNQINGRRSIEQSSEMAIRYLIELYDRFDNWPLAIAAYNLGPNAVAARLRKQPWDIGNPLTSLPVPTVTKDYVIHILGLAALLSDGELALPEPIETRAITIQPPVDLHLLADLSGLERNAIFRFNPALNRAQYLTQPVTVHVPADSHAKVVENIADAAPRFVYATVRKGDSLWRIAKRHNSDVKTLQRLNQGSGKLLRVGQKLKVPANQLAQASGNINPLLQSSQRIHYRVRPGDSLWTIAKRFGTTVKAITRINSLSRKGIIRAGDRLWVLARVRPS